MRAVVFAGPDRAELRDVPEPALRAPTDVLIDVEAAGVCGTDLHILAPGSEMGVAPGTILGHEFIGRVAAVGEAVTDRAVGDRVAIEPNLTCGSCDQCTRQRAGLCRNMSTLGISCDGGLAERAVVPVHKTIPLPESIATEDAVLVELVASVAHGFEALDAQVGEVGLVLGAGPAGLVFVQLLKASGCAVVVSEPSAERREAALRVGADAALAPDHDALLAAVEERGGCAGADVVIDAAGNLLPAAAELAGYAGRVLVFGMKPGARAEIRTSAIPLHGLTVHGTFGGIGYFPAAIRWLESGAVRAAGIVTARVALEDIPAGLAELAAGKQTKVVYDRNAVTKENA